MGRAVHLTLRIHDPGRHGRPLGDTIASDTVQEVFQNTNALFKPTVGIVLSRR